MFTSIVLHTLAVAAIYAAGRWHQRRIVNRQIVRARLGEPIEWNEVAK